jgi:predicted small secreted protein
MKKTLAILLMLTLLAVLFAGCSKKDGADKNLVVGSRL